MSHHVILTTKLEADVTMTVLQTKTKNNKKQNNNNKNLWLGKAASFLPPSDRDNI